MNNALALTMLNLLLQSIPEDVWKEPLAEALDALEDKVRSTANLYDDLALPVITRLREELDLPAYD